MGTYETMITLGTATTFSYKGNLVDPLTSVTNYTVSIRDESTVSDTTRSCMAQHVTCQTQYIRRQTRPIAVQQLTFPSPFPFNLNPLSFLLEILCLVQHGPCQTRHVPHQARQVSL